MHRVVIGRWCTPTGGKGKDAFSLGAHGLVNLVGLAWTPDFASALAQNSSCCSCRRDSGRSTLPLHRCEDRTRRTKSGRPVLFTARWADLGRTSQASSIFDSEGHLGRS